MNPLPSGVEQESSGDAEVMQDVFSGFAGALGTAVLFIYVMLVLLFANFLHPVTIMAALPLSLGGASAAVRQADVRGDAGFGGGTVAADFDDDDRDDSWDAANFSGNWRCSANSQPDGDCGNWRFDDFLAADSGGDSAGFYLHGWFANLDF